MMFKHVITCNSDLDKLHHDGCNYNDVLTCTSNHQTHRAAAAIACKCMWLQALGQAPAWPRTCQCHQPCPSPAHSSATSTKSLRSMLSQHWQIVKVVSRCLTWILQPELDTQRVVQPANAWFCQALKPLLTTSWGMDSKTWILYYDSNFQHCYNQVFRDHHGQQFTCLL
jgi:hypothetical protein